MKISCQSCQAKYTIADEKVLGKIVKIRCKKCGATIVINGNEAAAHPAQDQNDTNVYDYTQQQSGEQWTVNVADGDQRTMGLQEIISNFRGGVLNEETYIWKDGMADWLPIREVPEVFSAVQMGPRPSLHQEPSVPPPAATEAHHEQHQHHQHHQHQEMGALFGPSTTQDAPTEEVAAARNGNGPAPLFGESPPAAARRQGGRGAGGADLFGGVAAAGGEQDVMTSAAAGGEDQPKMTGARNENSVLFSLAALTNEPKPAENKTTASGDGSGLIDIRALSATMGAEDSKKNKQTHVDDIMNLGGGGAFGAALAAPVLAPPPMEAVDTTGTATGGKSKGLMFGLLGLGAFLFAGIIVAVLLLRGGSSTTPTGPGATSTTPTATATTSVAANDTSTAPTNTGGSSGSSGSDTTPANTSTAKAVSTGTSAMKGGTTPTHTAVAANTGGSGASTSAPVIPPAPTNTGGSGGGSLAEQLAKAAGASTGGGAATAAPAAAAAPFDRGAAAAALGGVNVASCKKADGPTGTGHVTVTFAPSGNVTSAVVDSPPFAGTPVGGCVAGKFRGAHVPPFSGGNVTVGKSFSLN